MQLSITIIFFFLETRNSMEIDGDRDNMFLKIELHTCIGINTGT